MILDSSVTISVGQDVATTIAAAAGARQSGSRPRSVRSCHAGPDPRHVSVVALPDAAASTLFGVYDGMSAAAFTGVPNASRGAGAPFHVEIVGEAAAPVWSASGVPISVQRSIDTVETTDVVIVPSVLVRPGGWAK